MTRARDVSRLITTPPNVYATDSEASAGFLSLSSASSIYEGAPYRNLIINGDMQIAQRGTSTASITTDGYRTADRWYANLSSLGTWTQSVENDAPTGSGFRNSLKMLCTTADASPAAGDNLSIQQRVEGQNLQQIKKGTAAAEQLTLSFWVKSNVTGTYIANISDIDNTRQVSKSYTINAVNTWEREVITFSADTTGAFDNDNALSMVVSLWLGSGTTYTSGTLETTWASTTNANTAVGQVNLASATNNYWQVTGVQLEVGDTATPFEFKPFPQNLRECQRYYYAYSNSGLSDTPYFRSVYVSSPPNSSAACDMYFPTTMRIAPTTITSVLNSGSVSRQTATTNMVVFQLASTAGGGAYNVTSYTVSAEL